LDNSSQDDTNEPPQAPITDAGQTPADDVGNTPATATPLAVNGAVVHAVIGNQVQDATGATVTDTDDYFSFNLVAGTSYNIPVLTDGSNNVTATWYGTDGMTSVTSGTTTTADPEFGYLTLTYTPTVSGTYYLDINQPDAATGYTVQVSDNPLVGTDSSVVLWTTTANATGGEFLFKPGIVNNSSDPNVATDYQASIVNVMDSTFEPTVLSATPNSLPAGTTLDVTLTGRKTNWIQGYSSVAFSGAGLTVNSVTVNSPTSITVSVTVASSAPPNFSNVTVSTQLGATTESAVGSNALQVTAADTSATLLQVEPSTLARGVTENVKVIGTLTSWNFHLHTIAWTGCDRNRRDGSLGNRDHRHGLGCERCGHWIPRCHRNYHQYRRGRHPGHGHHADRRSGDGYRHGRQRDTLAGGTWRTRRDCDRG